jgi:hypothetical protein
VNEVPPSQDPADEVDDLYRRASALDPSRPSEAVRRRVLDHAAQLAAERTVTAERAAAKRPVKVPFALRSYRSSWRPAIFGTLAAAALAGLLFAPEFLMPHGPGRVFSPDQASLQKAVQAPAVQAPAAPAPAAPAPAASVPAMQAPAARVAPTAPPPALAEAPTQYAADAPLVPAQREQEPRMFKRSVSGPYAAPSADSAASIAGKKAPDELQSAITTQNTAAASADAATEQRRARTTASPVAGLSAPPPAERVQVTAARRTDPAAELRRAAEIGDVAKLQTLLDMQSVVDARDADGRTALMLATLHGQARAVDVLLAHGADPNAADARGTTPLRAALAGNQPDIAAALQRAGAR